MQKLNLISRVPKKPIRWYLSLDYYWAIIGILIIPVIFAEIQEFNALGTKEKLNSMDIQITDMPGLWVKWFVIKISAFSIMFLALSILKFIFNYYSIKVLKARHIIIIGFLVGLLSGLVQFTLVYELGVFETGTIFARFFAPVPLTILILFSLSSLTSNIRKYRSELAKAEKDLDSLIFMQQIQQELLGGYKELSQSLSEKTNKISDQALEQLEELTLNYGPFDPSLPEKIRVISDSTIRDLSHQISSAYQRIDRSAPQNFLNSSVLSSAKAFWDSVNFAPLNPFAFASAFVLLLGGAIIRHANWVQALILCTGCFVILFSVHQFGLYIYRKFRWQNIFTVLAISIFSSVIPLLITYGNLFNYQSLIPDWSDYPSSPGLMFAGVLLITVVGYIQQAGLMVSEDILKNRKENIINVQQAAKPFNKEIVQISRNWARHLHGRVQSQILAATFNLEKAQDASDLEGVKRALAEISRILRSADKIEKFDSQTLGKEISRRTQQWSGIIEIALRISPDLLPRTGMEIYIIADIVEEMIANASRHGTATQIRIELSRRNPQQLSIRALDNGTHFKLDKKGFGSRFFDEVSQGRWEIARNTAFAETTVSLLFDLEDEHDFEHQPLLSDGDF